MLVHTLFDVAAWLCGLLAGVFVLRRYHVASRLRIQGLGLPYVIATAFGTLIGTFGLGTANLSLAGRHGVGRSILGAIIGGIAAVEAYKLVRGVRGSTGMMFVVPLGVGIAIGRIGCFLAGIDDFTYGTPTSLPWAVDFGDGVPRHPVQLYESLSMVAFLIAFLWALSRRPDTIIRCGFYLFALTYGGQRFVWEFLKPYPAVIGPFNLFHIACLALMLYAVAMMRWAEPVHARA
ncbi:MAG TPA: prolipoprotein diacylglyceryl transferase family protein [Candidatus Acidoferrum sp.]|nr:prolipoprotein diacylglyceryl transferase family protein [Candidatus Acidoferrum sp.]